MNPRRLPAPLRVLALAAVAALLFLQWIWHTEPAWYAPDAAVHSAVSAAQLAAVSARPFGEVLVVALLVALAAHGPRGLAAGGRELLAKPREEDLLLGARALAAAARGVVAWGFAVALVGTLLPFYLAEDPGALEDLGPARLAGGITAVVLRGSFSLIAFLLLTAVSDAAYARAGVRPRRLEWPLLAYVALPVLVLVSITYPFD